MKNPKILEDGENTFRNGGGEFGSGAICGGVVNKSLFDSDPLAYMMAWYMEDDKFAEYRVLKKTGKDKEATKMFNKYARSAI